MEQKVDPTVISAELWATGLVNNSFCFCKNHQFPWRAKSWRLFFCSFQQKKIASVSNPWGLFQLKQRPLRAINQGLKLSSGTQEIQGHCQVCSGSCEGTRTLLKTTLANHDWVFVKITFIYNGPSLQKKVKLLWPDLTADRGCPQMWQLLKEISQWQEPGCPSVIRTWHEQEESRLGLWSVEVNFENFPMQSRP